MKVNIPILLGTMRKGNKSQHAARYIESLLKQRDNVTTFVVNPADFELPPDGGPSDGQDPKYSKITKEADGFIIVTPEYNNSYPASLKRMMDSEYANYFYKPVAAMSVSDGPWGGVRVAADLAQPLRGMGLLYLRSTVQFPNVNDLFNELGELVADRERIDKMANGVFDEIIPIAEALKPVREQLMDKMNK